MSVLTITLATLLVATSCVHGDNMASIAVALSTGVVTVTKQWTTGGNLAGFRSMTQQLNLGAASNDFYSLSSSAIPTGGDVSAFKYYSASTGVTNSHADIGSKLTPDSYSGLTSADPDVGYGSVNFYFIHHKGTTDYFSVLVPSSGTASSVTDLKPMSGPGGPGTVTGVRGYVALAFAAANLGYGANMFYYLRKDSGTGVTSFGTLAPALSGVATDRFSLGTGTYSALEFVGPDIGFGSNKMYYLRQDSLTLVTVAGAFDLVTGASVDIANLGGRFTTLSYAISNLGFGASRFYVTGSVDATSQSISFSPIANRSLSSGAFGVTPTASSGLPITLTLVSTSTGSVNISGPVSGVFTITPTANGLVILQASQAGATSPTPYDSNVFQQRFWVTSTGGSAASTFLGTQMAFCLLAMVLMTL